MAATKKQMLTFLVERELLARLDDFQFTHRFRSRAAAIVWLLEKALDQEDGKQGTPEERASGTLATAGTGGKK